MPSLFHTQGPDPPNTVLNPGGDPRRHSLPSLSPLPRGAAHTEVGQDLAAPSTQHPRHRAGSGHSRHRAGGAPPGHGASSSPGKVTLGIFNLCQARKIAKLSPEKVISLFPT